MYKGMTYTCTVYVSTYMCMCCLCMCVYACIHLKAMHALD
jgi:hypothetical protein